jgi:hypothetical protein
VTTWSDVLRELEQSPDAIIHTPKGDLPPPLVSGAHRSSGMPIGQRGDFRWTLADCRGLHTREFADHWETHLDAVAPECSLVDHLEQDAPAVVVVASAVFGALAGWAVFGKRAAFAGAALGAGVGAFAIAPNPPSEDS